MPAEPPLNETARQAHANLERAANAAHETVDRVQQRAHEVTERLSSETDRYYRGATDWIAAHPMQALVAALVAGFVVGRMRR